MKVSMLLLSIFFGGLTSFAVAKEGSLRAVEGARELNDADAADYVITDGVTEFNSCPAGYEPLYNRAECGVAAESLGIPSNLRTTHFLNYQVRATNRAPFGCYQQSSSHNRVHVNPISTPPSNQDLIPEIKQICKRAGDYVITDGVAEFNSCPAGYEPLYDRAECGVAAESLGIPSNLRTTHFLNYQVRATNRAPFGCFQSSSGNRVHVNHISTPPSNPDLIPEIKQICKRGADADAPVIIADTGVPVIVADTGAPVIVADTGAPVIVADTGAPVNPEPAPQPQPNPAPEPAPQPGN